MDNIIDLDEELTRMTIENLFEGKYCENKKFKLLNRWFVNKINNIGSDEMNIYKDLQGEVYWLHEKNVKMFGKKEYYNVIEKLGTGEKEIIQESVFNNCFKGNEEE